jgi:hypothetical protein
MIGRIYRIESDIEGKFYIGSTTQTLARRINNHRSKSKEECRKKTPLYAHFNECGWEHASIQLICEQSDVTPDQLLRLEKEEIMKYTSNPLCLNKSIPVQTLEEKKAADKEYSRLYREKDKQAHRDRLNQWRLDNPDKWKEQTKRYREKKKAHQDLSANHAAT